MKILITGAGGFAAARIIAAWKDRYEITGTGRAQLDFTNKEECLRVIGQVRPQIVIHCGAVSDVGACDKDPGHSYLVNVTGAENIALACRETGARMIFSVRIRYTSEMTYRNRTERTNSSPPAAFTENKSRRPNKDALLPSPIPWRFA